MEEKKKGVAILGSTGSIGTQALEVLRSHPERFSVEVLSAGRNVDLLAAQAAEFLPDAVVIGEEGDYERLKGLLGELPVKVYRGKDSLCSLMSHEAIDIVLTAMVGFSGLEPTLAAIRNRKPIALANKETLVVAGDLVTRLAREEGVNIYPVDSEHSAIFQCLAGEWHNRLEKIILTASGGPFRGKMRHELSEITPARALKHPNWSMGAKISIDSATLMNKGLEMMEARWLFGLEPGQIEVIVHPQSIIHSLVQFADGSMKAQMGLPDMKLPIVYALGYPDRLATDYPRFDFLDFPLLSFEKADEETFRCLALAREVMSIGGHAPCILNAANEVAVAAFLEERIAFLAIAEIIEETLEKYQGSAIAEWKEYEFSDREARRIALECIRKRSLTKI